ncbi:MAG: hypothetical protein LBE55_02490 [Clostridiales bacterium]|jgi:hypothetical protein|nr:hypothetical protein [Clostridiales bacterium]
MPYETKVILSLLAKNVGKAKSVKEAYLAVVDSANVEGLLLPTYEEYQQELKKLEKEQS